jgi:hypothetical protein
MAKSLGEIRVVNEACLSSVAAAENTIASVLLSSSSFVSSFFSFSSRTFFSSGSTLNSSYTNVEATFLAFGDAGQTRKFNRKIKNMKIKGYDLGVGT